MTRLLLLLALLLLAACAPSTEPKQEPVTLTQDLATYQSLVAPFTEDLERLGITLTNYQTYRYEGDSPNGFVQAVNTFYRTNPGFCPLAEAFYAAPNGVQFMTVAGNGSTQIRAFLYDQSRRPRLTHAYVSGTSQQPLPAVTCETVTGK